MPDLSFSSTELLALALEALENGDVDGAVALADNAQDTAEAESEEEGA